MKSRISISALAFGLGWVATLGLDGTAFARTSNTSTSRFTRRHPAPSPTPSPTPTPTPTPTSTTPTPTLATGDYAAQWSMLIVADPTQYNDPIVTATHPTTVRYDAASHTYTFEDGSSNSPLVISPAERVATQSTAAYTAYRDAESGKTVRILNQSASNPLVALSYVSYAKWRDPPTSTGIKFADEYVVFGSVTPSANIPRSGSASYNAVLDGNYQNQAGNYALNGNATYVANFGNATMGVTATLVGTHASNGSQLQFGTLTGGGYIWVDGSAMQPNTRFSAITPYIGTTRYASYGNFFGPQANEIGGTFTLKSSIGGSAGEGAGVFVGNKN